MRVSSRIQRISCESGEADGFSMLRVGLASGDRWSGLRIQGMQSSGPGELPESYLPRHLVTVNDDRPTRWTAKWLDGPEVEIPDNGPPNTVCLFPAMQPFRARWEGATAGIFIELSQELLDEAARRAGANRHVDLRPGLAAEDRVIPQLAEALFSLACRDDAPSTLLAESLGLALATYLAQSYAASQIRPLKHRGGIDAGRLRLLEEFIDARIHNPISLSDLASLTGMSVFHFAHCFRQSTGVAPHRYVMRRRIERARQLLANPKLGVADVALRCGFSHQSHFSEVFRRMLGTTPKQYRIALGVGVDAANSSRKNSSEN
jgi:AraC family transcriptional regulator